MPRFQAVRQYQDAGVAGAAQVAEPAQLVVMLLDGALDRIARARGAARGGDRNVRMANVSRAIAIVEHLRLCLDRRAGALADRLDALYDFVLRRLALANASEDPAAFEEAAVVLRTLKSAWDQIVPAPAAA